VSWRSEGSNLQWLESGDSKTAALLRKLGACIWACHVVRPPDNQHCMLEWGMMQLLGVPLTYSLVALQLTRLVWDAGVVILAGLATFA
jgi:hypothetical protein